MTSIQWLLLLNNLKQLQIIESFTNFFKIQITGINYFYYFRSRNRILTLLTVVCNHKIVSTLISGWITFNLVIIHSLVTTINMSQYELNKFTDDRLDWLHHPTSWNTFDESGEAEGAGGSADVLDETLVLFPPAKKDFWSKTFYSPELVKHDASALLAAVPSDEATIGISFHFTPISQFDQAGILVYLDDDHWMKCGIEYCDNSPRLSVVVCNGFSDWSTQLWTGFGARLKVHKVLQADSVVVEAAPIGSDEFHFVRIAHLSSTPIIASAAYEEGKKSWRVGPYAASPIAQKGCAATFTNFYIGPKESSSHSEIL